ncbi:hypothetical protein RHODOP_04615 [Rhodoplanes sp. P11]
MRGRVRPPVDRTRRPGWNGQELAGFLGVRQYGGRLADRRIRSVRRWAVGRRAGAARGVIVSHTVTGVPWCTAGTPGAWARGMTPCGRAPMAGAHHRAHCTHRLRRQAAHAAAVRPPCGDDAWPRSRRECGRRDRAGPDRAGPDRAGRGRTAGDRAEPDGAGPDRAARDRATRDRAEPDRAVGTPRTRAGASCPAGGGLRGAKLSPRANSPRREALRDAKLSATQSSPSRPRPSPAILSVRQSLPPRGKLAATTGAVRRTRSSAQRSFPPSDVFRCVRSSAVCGLPPKTVRSPPKDKIQRAAIRAGRRPAWHARLGGGQAAAARWSSPIPDLNFTQVLNPVPHASQVHRWRTTRSAT